MNRRKILIVTQTPGETGGSFVSALAEKSIQPTYVHLHEKETIPLLKDYSALVVLGGMESANSTSPQMQHLLNKIREVLQENIPYFGVCLGMQTLVKAAGGKVIPSASKEIGFRITYEDPQSVYHAIRLTEMGRKDQLFKNLDDTIPVFQLHTDTVELTQDMQLLATHHHNGMQHQVIKIGKRAYGIQGHFEATPDALDLWLQHYPGFMNQHEAIIRSDFKLFHKTYVQTGKQLFNNFLDMIE